MYPLEEAGFGRFAGNSSGNSGSRFETPSQPGFEGL
jgi:hypothetical protein